MEDAIIYRSSVQAQGSTDTEPLSCILQNLRNPDTPLHTDPTRLERGFILDPASTLY